MEIKLNLKELRQQTVKFAKLINNEWHITFDTDD